MKNPVHKGTGLKRLAVPPFFFWSLPPNRRTPKLSERANGRLPNRPLLTCLRTSTGWLRGEFEDCHYRVLSYPRLSSSVRPLLLPFAASGFWVVQSIVWGSLGEVKRTNS